MSTFRCFSKSNISLGLLSIPVKFYKPASDAGLEFRMLTKAGNLIKQKYVDAVTGEDTVYAELDKGYEYAKGQFVRFTKDELAALDMKSDTLDIKEFVALSDLDFIQVEKNYYLGPEKGGDKGYALLAAVLEAQGKAAIAQWTYQGKQHLVAIRGYQGGLVLQVLFYKDEVRDFKQIEVLPLLVTDAERHMAEKLVEALTNDAFDVGAYEDNYAKTVRQAVDSKISGKEVILVAEEAPTAKVIDLFEALKASLQQAPAKGKKPAPKGKAKK